jgi:hypothetical protein
MSVPMARVPESSRETEAFPAGPVVLRELGCVASPHHALQRRMSPYDRRLLRPALVPALARLVRRFMRS